MATHQRKEPGLSEGGGQLTIQIKELEPAVGADWGVEIGVVDRNKVKEQRTTTRVNSDIHRQLNMVNFY